MKVRCKIHDLKIIAGSQFEKFYNLKTIELRNIGLTYGKIYTVLALTNIENSIWVYLMSDDGHDYPIPFPNIFFAIKDGSVSNQWDYSSDMIENFEDLDLVLGKVISFKPWRDQKSVFYEKILDEDKHTMSIFNEYKDKMIAE